MFDKFIVVTQHRLSFFSQNGDASVMREYLQGEESQDVTNDSKDSLTRVFAYINKSQLLHGCKRVRVMYDEELDPNTLNSLVGFINEKANIKSYEVIQFKTMLPELLLKSVSTEINSPVQVQLCDCTYRIDIDDSTLIINRQNDPASTDDYVWNDEAMVSLTITDSYPALNAYKIEELQDKVQKLEGEIGKKNQENRSMREDLRKTKKELVLKTLAHDASLKELSVLKDKEQKERERKVFRAYDIPRIKKYLGLYIFPALFGYGKSAFIERMKDTDMLVTINQPIFRFTFDKQGRTTLGTYEFVLKAGRTGRLFCFLSSLRNKETSSFEDLLTKLKNSNDKSYNPVLFVIADENDTEPEIRKWCYEQGYDFYE